MLGCPYASKETFRECAHLAITDRLCSSCILFSKYSCWKWVKKSPIGKQGLRIGFCVHERYVRFGCLQSKREVKMLFIKRRRPMIKVFEFVYKWDYDYTWCKLWWWSYKRVKTMSVCLSVLLDAAVILALFHSKPFVSCFKRIYYFPRQRQMEAWETYRKPFRNHSSPEPQREREICQH